MSQLLDTINQFKKLYKTLLNPTEENLAEVAAAQNPVKVKPEGENLVPFKMLEKFESTPRDIEGEAAVIVGKPPMFGKENWKKEMSEAPLIYAGVIQANEDLFYPGKNELLAAVLLFAEDPEHMRNTEWIKKTFETIEKVRNSDDVPHDARKFISELRDDESRFCMELPASLADGAKAWVAVHKLDKQADLPKGYIPDDRILPFLLIKAKDAWSNGISLIPAKGYIK